MASRREAHADSASTTVVSAAVCLPEIGRMVADKYRIERRIAKGGMGTVYVAHHELLQRNVALKVMSADQANTSEALARFRKEARAVAGIQSEHVARVLDAGSLADGTPFMVLELLEGADLACVLERGAALPIADVIDWVLQALEGLAEAHALGIVHRDIKPANLFLARRRDGTSIVKVLDFGVSKHYPVSDPTPTLTVTSSIIGSPLYTAPEQLCNAKSVDARADIWAVGVVLYELLAGRPPFQGDNVAALFIAILERSPPSLRRRRAEVPLDLEKVVMRCLSQDPEERFQNVADLAEALAPFGPKGALQSAERTGHIIRTAAQWTSSATRTKPLPGRRRRASGPTGRPRAPLRQPSDLARMGSSGRTDPPRFDESRCGV
jgi:eukaryotic-like serine/threonine-protein kinase